MTDLRILAVCTANVCRSPVVERLLSERLGDAGHRVMVSSAGTWGGSLDVHPDTRRAAAEIGVDLSGHVSRRITAAILAEDGADLVVTMTREHLRDVVALDPGAWPRTFTLKELARRTLQVPSTTTDFGGWLAAVAEGRRAADLMVPSTDDDVTDPYGGPYRGHLAMVREVDELVTRLARLLPRPE